MNVYIFTKKETALKSIFPKNTQFLPLPLSKHEPVDGDISYIDISTLADTDLKKTLTQFKKYCKDTPWGIIDPNGSIKDTASVFFEGASDYLGTNFLKSTVSIEPKRLKEALLWRKNAVIVSSSAAAKENEQLTGEQSYDKQLLKEKGTSFLKAGIKLPSASSFPGWKKIPEGKTMPFYLLYCSLQGKTTLDTRMEDKAIVQIYKRFVTYLDNSFKEANGLSWMNSGKDCLFLLPPSAKCAETAIKACIRMIISTPLIVMETLGITVPLNFIFALHYGSLSYNPPGRTGTVVSDAVNFVFHLGAKKAEPGRLTISGELPDVTIPKSLEDCFVSAGEFEDRKIWHTKKFSYAKPWM